MKIGAHVKTAGGVDKAIDRARDIGAETIQIFSGAPQAWRRKVYSTEEVQAYKLRAAETGIGPAFVHGVYLVNLATDNPENLAKGIDALAYDMNACHLLGCLGVPFLIETPGFDNQGPDRRNVEILKTVRERVAAA